MLNFQFNMPTRLIFAPGSLGQLCELPLPPGSKAMIVIGSSGAMITAGYLGRVQGLLAERGVMSLIYDKVMPNPESDQVHEAAAICRDKDIDFVVGLGGGSTIDAAKAICLLATNGGEWWDYLVQGSGRKQVATKAALPLIAIPTTAGTGTEVTPVAVITKKGEHEKIGWGNESMFPKLSLVDPELMVSLSPRQTAYTGMDAFFHAAEGFLSSLHQPLTDMTALEAVHLAARFLPNAVRDGSDIEARTYMAWSSTAAGITLSQARVTSQHSMEHALSAMNTDLPHGAGLTLLSRDYFTRIGELAPERFGDLATAMGVENVDALPVSEHPAAFVVALDTLINKVGLGDERLADYDFSEDQSEQLADIAHSTMGLLFTLTPGKMTREDTVGIFRKAILR